MGFFTSPNDQAQRTVLEYVHTQDSKTYIGQIIDPRQDGNFTDRLAQSWSVILVGWGTQVNGCRPMIPQGDYNGGGTYRNYGKGDGVMLVPREGQMDELLIIGSIRLNGDHQKFLTEGQGLEPGELITDAAGNVAPANQPGLQPVRVTKPDAEFQFKNSNNLMDVYQNPALTNNIQENMMAQGLPGVITEMTKEGVHMTYAHEAIIHYTEGNIVNVVNGTKQNRCSKYLKAAVRHKKIAEGLDALSSLNVDVGSANIEDLIEYGDVSFEGIDFGPNNPGQSAFRSESFNISADTPLYNTVSGTIDRNPFIVDIPKEDEVAGEQVPSDGTNVNLANTYRGDEIRSPAYRARKHRELAELCLETADDCNKNYAAFHATSNQMSNALGNHFGNGGIPSQNITIPEPDQFFGNVDPQNYSSRNTGVPKPAVVTTPADTNNYDASKEYGEHLPIKRIFLHNTAYDLKTTIATFQNPKEEVSAHYTIARDGTIHQHVPDNLRAFHATKTGNGNSIGIEHVATETERGLTDAQEQSSIKLIKYLVSVYNIDKSKIAGHRTVYDTRCPDLCWPTEENLRTWVNENI